MAALSQSLDQEAAATSAEVEDTDVSAAVGRKLKRLRVQQGHSIERLARLSGVSRAMISQIELGRSVPTISLLWKIARALEVRFAALIQDTGPAGTSVMRADRAKILTSADGKFTSRALFPFDSPRRVKFYKLTLGPHATQAATPHPPGTVENLVVGCGEVEVVVAGASHRLREDDAILFEADVPHSYRNAGPETATMWLVMSYVEKVG